jgi:Coenzyme PQQ synthesis protein D (PqqD)
VSECAQTLQFTLHADEVGLPMYKVSEGIRSAHGQDGAIVLDIRQGQMFNLNFVGSRILELLQGGSAQSQIVDEIIREFGVGRDRAEHDVQEFLQALKKNCLVEEYGPNNAT